MAQEIIRSIAPDGKEVLSNILGEYVGDNLTYKEVNLFSDGTPITDEMIERDRVMYIKKFGKYFKQAKGEYRLEDYGFSVENTKEENALIFNHVQTLIPENSLVKCATGRYNVDNVVISKSGFYDFKGVVFLNNQEIANTAALTVSEEAGHVSIEGLSLEYKGRFYASNAFFPQIPIEEVGVVKIGLLAQNRITVLSNCSATGFSSRGFHGSPVNKSFYLSNCTSSNNGHSGASSEGSDFQVIGGQYNENGGGGTAAADGYGVVGNVSVNGNFKCIGVTAERNRTRNIDSHQGHDIIIANCYAVDAGVALPQWFDVAAEESINIRLTRRIHRCIVVGNIAKRALLANISFDSNYSSPNRVIKQIIISNNVCEDGRFDIYIRQAGTEHLTVTNNQCIQTGARASDSPTSFQVNPLLDSSDMLFIRNMDISGNQFDAGSNINLSNIASSIHKTLIRYTGNTSKTINIICNNIESNIIVTDNFTEKVTISGTSINSTLNFTGNTFDAKTGEQPRFSSFVGHITYNDNYLLNIHGTTIITISSNTTFKNNKIFNYGGETQAVIMIFPSSINVECEGNVIKSTNPTLRAIRATLSNSVIVKNNIHAEQCRIDLSDGSSKTVRKINFDPPNYYFDVGFIEAPLLGDYVFNAGSFAKRFNITANTGIGWLCTSQGSSGAVWREVGLPVATQTETNSGTDTERAITPSTLNGRLSQGVVSTITTADATDEATAIALANENKAKINEIITKLSTIIFK